MNKILTTVSVIALLGTTSAFADEKQGVKENLNDKKDEIVHEIKESHEELKSFVFGEDSEKLEIKTMNLNADFKAENIIGKPVYNLKERVGTVHDIILDGSGDAVMAIIADGEIFGFGKLVAFDYSSLTENQLDGKFMMAITEDTIDQVAEFSYERNNTNDNVRVIPQHGYSLVELLDGDLTNDDGEKIAEVEDVYLDDGKASHLIVKFDDVMDDEEVAIGYEIAEIVAADDEYNFQLLSPNDRQFEDYKKTARN